MLFRPPHLDAVANRLDEWNREADRYRRAAELARNGEPPSPLLVEAARETYDDLMELTGDIDAALARISGGQSDFARLLKIQVTALALGESVGHTLDMLELVAEPVSGASPTPDREGLPLN